MKKRIIFITLTLIWMAVIFWFSSLDSTNSGAHSESVTQLFISLFINEPSENLITAAETIVRKLAHFAEYFILGGLVFGTVKSFVNKNISQ